LDKTNGHRWYYISSIVNITNYFGFINSKIIKQMTKEISKSLSDKVRSKLTEIKTKLDQMEIAKNAGPQTNGIFHWSGREGIENNTTSTIKISAVTNIALLLGIFGYLLTKRNEYEMAANRLDMDTFPMFKWSGYSLEAWENDIRARINTITHSSEVEKLNKLYSELSKYVSEEDRVEELLKELG